MCAHRDWPEFRKIIGGKYLFSATTLDGVPYKPSSYDHDQLLKISVADKEHPITKGVEDFQILDETYKGFWTDPHAKVLLRTDHPKNNPELAWVTEYGKSRGFYLMLGHDRKAYDNPGYRKVLYQAIRWAAAR
jgi:type 1 glutamine amidotransferase